MERNATPTVGESGVLVEDILVSTNSITDLMDEELKKCIRTILYILESNWPLQDVDKNKPRHIQVRKDQTYQSSRKAILDGFNDYNRYFILRILNPLFIQNNESVDSLHDRIRQLEKEIALLKKD